MKKYIDSSAMIIADGNRVWGYDILFNHDAMRFKQNLDPVYCQYFPPEEKKFDEKVAVVYHLNLKTRKPLKVLDIGTGCGHFITLLSKLGHDCQGTEIPESIKTLKPLHDYYNLNVFNLEIKKQTRFELPKKYDLITTLRTVFDYDGPWTLDDWQFFKENLFEYLEPGGEVFIKTNIKSIPSNLHRLDRVFGRSLVGWNSLTFHIKKS